MSAFATTAAMSLLALIATIGIAWSLGLVGFY